jgi:hypothetical protein
MPIQKKCIVCDAEFSVPPVRANTAMFCGKACKAKHASNKYKQDQVKCLCGQCGKEFYVPQSRHERGNGKFCSNKCRNESMLGKRFTPLSNDGVTTKHTDGYILERCANHPFNVAGYVMQHRLVIENEMRLKVPEHHFLVEVDSVKYLKRGIEVHHVNEVKDDNRINNLIACTLSGHKDLHAGKVPMTSECWPSPKETVADEARYKTIQCQKCNKCFEVKLSVWKKRGAKYCSNKCASGYSGDLPSIVYKNCEACGQEYSLTRSVFLAGKSKYCSNTCRNKSIKRNHHGK